MKNKKKFLIIGIIIFVLLVVVLLFTFFPKNNNLAKYEASNSTTDSIDMSINTDNGSEKIDWSKYQYTDYELTESITITEAGVYNLTGTLDSGVVKIDTTGDVKLVLNNVSITNSSGPAIYVANAENVIIHTVEGSTNYLEDGATYSGYDAEVIGTIFSHDDITFEGSGTLEVKSNSEDAIVSKDDLNINSGTFKISSVDDGIRGKDSVYIKNGTFNITSSGDGIKSTNDTDVEKGYILIENGTFDITSDLDAIQSQTKLLIEDGTFNITTGGGSSNSSSNSNSQNNWGHWGSSTSSDTTSAKGLKSGDNLVIENGTFTFNTSDDAIHCNNYVGIKNGTLTIDSGDDGIHADTELIIDGGKIDIAKSYEGLEASKITINGGDINVVADDDGINVAGGNDSSSFGRPGANSFSSSSDNVLTINGGTIYVNATGDGIDVNGSAYVNGGETKVDGPTNDGNGALDYDSTFEVNAGVFLAGGSSGMMQGISSSSKLYNLAIGFTSTYGSDDIITIVDNFGNEVISYSSSKNYSSIVVATPSFQKGESYTIKINGSNYNTFAISNITTSIGNVNSMGGFMGNPMEKTMGNPGGGGFQERPGGRR